MRDVIKLPVILLLLGRDKYAPEKEKVKRG